MEKNKDVIQTHPLIGWDISTVDSYDAMMLRLHYLTSNNQKQDETGENAKYPANGDALSESVITRLLQSKPGLCSQ